MKRAAAAFAGLLLLASLVCAVPPAALAAAVSSEEPELVEGFTCQSEKVEAEILPDGTVEVTEYWTFSTRKYEVMSLFERTVPKPARGTMSVPVLYSGSRPMELLEDYDESRPVDCYAVKETENGYAIQAYTLANNQSFVLKVQYTLTGAVRFHADGMEFNWTLLDGGVPYGAKLFTGYVILPFGAERDELKAWSHTSAPSTTLTLESGELVSLVVDELEPHTPVDIRVFAPGYLFPNAPENSGETALPRILEEENDPAANPARQASERRKELLIQIGVPAVLLLCVVLIPLLSRRRRKKRGQL